MPPVGADEISQLLDALNNADSRTRRAGVPVVEIPEAEEKRPAPKKTTGNLRLTGNIQPVDIVSPPPSAPSPEKSAEQSIAKASDAADTAGFVLPELESLVSFEEGTAQPPRGREWVPGETPVKKKGKVKAPPKEKARVSDWTTGNLVYLIIAVFAVAAYVFFYIIRPGLKESGAVASSAKSVTSATKSVLQTATEKIEVAKAAASAASAVVADAVDGVTKKISSAVSSEKDEPAKAADEVAEEVPEIVIPDSKYLPPWMKKDDVAGDEKKEVVIKVPEVIDSPEVKEWPELKVSAVLAGGTRGGALVNGAVVSVGEATADGPVLKSVSKQAAVFEWDGETRTFFVNAKPEK